MSTQWKRYLSLTVNNMSWSGEADTLPRIRFQIQSAASMSLNKAGVIITNLSASRAKSILQGCEGKKLTLDAGYVNNHGTIYKGNITQVRIGRENQTDTYVKINCATGDLAANHGVINKSLKAGSTPKDHLQALAQAFEKYGVTLGQIPSSFSSPKYPRAVAFYGMAKDYLRTLAHSKGCTWSIQNDVLQMVPLGDTLGGAVVLNANTGMIGLPIQTQDAIEVKALINPAITIHTALQLNNSSIQQATASDQLGSNAISKATMPNLPADGLYTVLRAVWDGDTRGLPWYVTSTCLAKNGASGSLAEAQLKSDASSATRDQFTAAQGSSGGGGNSFQEQD